MATKPRAVTTSAEGDKTYTVKYVVNHDGEEYPVGSQIVLSDKYAVPLLGVDAISDPSVTADDEAA